MKTGYFLFVVLCVAFLTILSGCIEHEVVHEQIYIGIAPYQPEHKVATEKLINDAFEPKGMSRALPAYIHVDNLAPQEKLYDVLSEGPPRPELVAEENRMGETVLKKLRLASTLPENSLITGLNRVKDLAIQASQDKIRASILLSGFDLMNLSEEGRKQIQSTANLIVQQKQRFSSLCIIGIATGPPEASVANYFHEMPDIVVVTDPSNDQKFQSCFRK